MSVTHNLLAVRERIAEAAARVGRDPSSIRLIGITSISKGVPLQEVLEAIEAGLEDLGENRVQDAATRIPALAQAGVTRPHWHLVGHLQTNKVKAAVDLFEAIHSVDSLRLAERLARLSPEPLPVFLEVQFVEQFNRFGFTPESIHDAFEATMTLPGLQVSGLMTVAPQGLTAEDARPVFRTLREIRDAIQEAHPHASPLGLSMGMTDDYPVAIEEGATAVRIGRAIFS